MAILTGRGTTFAIASDDEAFSGADVNKAITPDQLMSVVSRGLETVTGGLTYQGVFDANDLSPDLSNARQGDFYKISVAGTAYGATYAVGDMLLVNADMGGTITNGKIDKVDSSESLTNLDDLIDVTVSNAINGQVLQYLNGEWVNRPSAGATTLNDLSDVTLGTLSGGDVLKYNGTNWVDDTLATSDISGLGSIATQDANNVSITGGSIAGITDLAIADGGTGASTAAAARTNLELEIGVDVQAFNDRLTDIAGLTPNDNSIIVGNGSNFVLETGATAQASLGLGTAATKDFGENAGNLVELDENGKLPEIDGSQLTNLPSGGGLTYSVVTSASYTASAGTHAHYLGTGGNTWNVTLPAKSTLSAGDVFAFSRSYAGSTVITKNTADGNCIVTTNTSATAGSITIDSQPSVFYLLYNGTNFYQAQSVLGSGAELDADNSANNLVKLDFQGRLPQLDGSLLTNMSFVPAKMQSIAATTLTLSSTNASTRYWLPTNQSTDITVNLPLASTLADGDTWVFQRYNGGTLNFYVNANEPNATDTLLRFGTSSINKNNGPIAVTTVRAQSFTLIYDTATKDFYLFDSVFMGEVIDDTTPQLGGDLDVNGNVITSASNGVVEITPDGTGTVNLGGNTNSATLKFYDDDNSNFVALKAPATASLTANVTFTLPVEDGGQDQVLKTDGSGQLGWATAASGGASDLDGLSDVTITNAAGQQVLRHNGTNFVNAQLAYSDLTGTPTVPSSSDDLTSDHTGVNYTGATTDSLTTHLAGIDSALATAGGGATLAVQSNTSYTLAASDAKGIHIWYAPNNTSTFTVTMPDIADVLSSNVSSNGDPGATFEVYVGRARAGDITISAADGIDILGDGERNYKATQTVDAGEWIKLIAWRDSASTQRYLMDGASQPRNAALDSISGLTTSANQLIYTTGSDTYATASLTAAGRALLDDADAAAQRATLGAIGEVSDDTTPQLGGDLDLNGNDIVTTGNADLELAPNGAGVVVVKGNNNSGAIKLNCEQNSHGVTLQSPDHLDITASYTLTLPTDVGTQNQVLKATNSTGQLGWADPAGLTVVEVASSTTSVSATPSNFYIVETTSGNTTNVTLPQLPGSYSVGDRLKIFHHGDGVLRLRENSSGTTLDPNDASSLNQTERSINPRSMVEIVLTGSGGTPSQYEYAISPQIEFEPDSDNQVLYYDATNLSMKPLGYTFPTSDGAANQVLQTDGNGSLTFQTLSSGGGGGPTYSAITANTTAAADHHYSCTGSITLTLPTSGISAGSEVRVKNMGTGTITIDPQTGTIDGSSTNRTLTDQYSALILISTGSNWEII